MGRLPVASAIAYDIVRGSLDELRATGGDFSYSTESCLTDNTGAIEFQDTDNPAASSGFWYLLRVVYSASGFAGSYDVDGTGTSRDDGIALALEHCP